jgi:hypothetical protein
MSQSRMNLFRDLNRAQPRASKVAIPMQLKLAGFIIVVTSATMVRSYFHFKKTSRLIAEETQRLDQQILEFTESKAREAANRPREVADVKPAAPPPSDGLDGTWTSLMWKIATGADVGIALEKLGLNEIGSKPPSNGGTPPPQETAGLAREVVLEGEARSLRDVTSWLEELTRRIPGFAFVIEHQDASKNPDFPVGFKVIARQG